MRERNDYKGVPDMREIRKFIKSISGHKNFDPNYYSSEVLTMTNLVYSLFNFDFIFERQKKNGYGANKYRFFEEKLGVSFRIHFTLLLSSHFKNVVVVSVIFSGFYLYKKAKVLRKWNI